MKRCEVKLLRKVCTQCKARPARFVYAGRVKWDRFHNCCGKCYRANWDRMRTEGNAQNHSPQPLPILHTFLIRSAEERLTFVHELASERELSQEAQLGS